MAIAIGLVKRLFQISLFDRQGSPAPLTTLPPEIFQNHIACHLTLNDLKNFRRASKKNAFEFCPHEELQKRLQMTHKLAFWQTIREQLEISDPTDFEILSKKPLREVSEKFENWIQHNIEKIKKCTVLKLNNHNYSIYYLPEEIKYFINLESLGKFRTKTNLENLKYLPHLHTVYLEDDISQIVCHFDLFTDLIAPIQDRVKNGNIQLQFSSCDSIEPQSNRALLQRRNFLTHFTKHFPISGIKFINI